MARPKKYDFSGWATRNDVKCSDGRTIRDNAFKDNDGAVVPLVWQHMHDSPSNVLGHAYLENVPKKGVRTYGVFNDTEMGTLAKTLVSNGDIVSLSIYANQLKQNSNKDVLHGNIREVSLVLAGANPEAFIDFPVLAHGEESDEDAIIYMNSELAHSDEEEDEEEKDEPIEDEEDKPEEEEDMAHNDKDKTVKDILDTLDEDQKKAVAFLLTEALNDKADEDKDDDDDDEEEQKVKHNIFDSDEQTKNYLEHSDELSILEMAKSPNYGSFKAAVEAYENENDVTIMHDGISGFAQEGEGNVTYLFPEYKDVRSGAPELITNDQGWVDVVLKKVHKSPMSRIRTSHVDIRNIDELRAKGYKKGDKKAVTGNFKLVRRTTDPQTVYVRSNLHRDDIVDITDFDYVQYLYNIDRMNLNEEVATAILFGDGRDDGAADKIMPEHIRPIWTDDDLYTIHYDLDVAEAKKILQGNKTNDYFGENYVTAEAMVNACLYAREKSKGTGTPDMFIDPHMVNVMLLARDRNGRRIYASKAELAAALNVGNIYTVEQMADKTRVAGVGANAKVKKLHALIVNLNDYQVGSTKGGEITHFTQFDIDFNQQKSLLETRLSGANTKLWSAIAIEETIGDAPAAPVDDDLDNPVDDEF